MKKINDDDLLIGFLSIQDESNNQPVYKEYNSISNIISSIIIGLICLCILTVFFN